MKNKKKRRKEKCYIHNIFSTNLKRNIVTGCYWWQKSNFTDGLKLKPVTTRDGHG